MPDALRLPLSHRRRLREVWRSALWPCRDTVELELLAQGLLARERDPHGRETLHLTDAGVCALAGSVDSHRQARSPHEQLVERVALDMQRAGRIVWRGLVLRAPLAGPAVSPGVPAGVSPLGLSDALDALDAHEPVEAARGRVAAPADEVPGSTAGRPWGAPTGAIRWVQAMPDVYSIRHTTREDQVLPIVHEIKVRRADLLADLRRPDKRAAYLALASQCWYVLKAGIAEPGEIPPECGVMVAHEGPHGALGGRLEVLRPAPQRPHRLALGTWMALARAAAEPLPEEPAQPLLREG